MPGIMESFHCSKLNRSPETKYTDCRLLDLIEQLSTVHVEKFIPQSISFPPHRLNSLPSQHDHPEVQTS